VYFHKKVTEFAAVSPTLFPEPEGTDTNPLLPLFPLLKATVLPLISRLNRPGSLAGMSFLITRNLAFLVFVMMQSPLALVAKFTTPEGAHAPEKTVV